MQWEMEKSKLIESVRSGGKSEVVCYGNDHAVRYVGGVISSVRFLGAMYMKLLFL